VTSVTLVRQYSNKGIVSVGVGSTLLEHREFH